MNSTHVLARFKLHQHELELFGKSEPQLRNGLIELICRQARDAFSYLMTGVRGHSLLWIVPPPLN